MTDEQKSQDSEAVKPQVIDLEAEDVTVERDIPPEEPLLPPQPASSPSSASPASTSSSARK